MSSACLQAALLSRALGVGLQRGAALRARRRYHHRLFVARRRSKRNAARRRRHAVGGMPLRAHALARSASFSENIGGDASLAQSSLVPALSRTVF